MKASLPGIPCIDRLTFTRPGVYTFAIDERSINSLEWVVGCDSYEYVINLELDDNGKLVPTGELVKDNRLDVDFTNLYIDNRVALSGEKEWFNDTVADRPASITAKLMQRMPGEEDAVMVDKQVVTPDGRGKWLYDFGTLHPKYDAQMEEIEYWVEEDPVAGYEGAHLGPVLLVNCKSDTPVTPTPTPTVIPVPTDGPNSHSDEPAKETIYGRYKTINRGALTVSVPAAFNKCSKTASAILFYTTDNIECDTIGLPLAPAVQPEITWTKYNDHAIGNINLKIDSLFIRGNRLHYRLMENVYGGVDDQYGAIFDEKLAVTVNGLPAIAVVDATGEKASISFAFAMGNGARVGDSDTVPVIKIETHDKEAASGLGASDPVSDPAIVNDITDSVSKEEEKFIKEVIELGEDNVATLHIEEPELKKQSNSRLIEMIIVGAVLALIAIGAIVLLFTRKEED